MAISPNFGNQSTYQGLDLIFYSFKILQKKFSKLRKNSSEFFKDLDPIFNIGDSRLIEDPHRGRATANQN
ncbi:hypothetical protein V6Z11_D01G132200 [Gossypium hirsutum]